MPLPAAAVYVFASDHPDVRKVGINVMFEFTPAGELYPPREKRALTIFGGRAAGHNPPTYHPHSPGRRARPLFHQRTSPCSRAFKELRDIRDLSFISQWLIDLPPGSRWFVSRAPGYQSFPTHSVTG